MKRYYKAISMINKITPKHHMFYLRFHDGLQNTNHFGFHFIIWHLVGRVSVSRCYYGKIKINKSIPWLG